MFQQFKNIETAFSHVRLFSFVLISACVIIVCFTVYWSDQRVEKAQDKVLILLNGKVISAIGSGRRENIPIEAKDHIKSFHELFFSLAPDDKLIEHNIKQALYLSDVSAKKQYDNLSEGGYYSGIVSGNVSQRITTDSIYVDLKAAPYYFRYFGVQQLVRPTSTLSRSLITEGYLREVDRSENNPHGFLIEKWNIIENRDLEMEER